MEPDKPEGYPFIKLDVTDGGWRPTMYDWHPNGYEQITDFGQPEDDRHMAKHAACEWSKTTGVPYKRAIDL